MISNSESTPLNPQSGIILIFCRHIGGYGGEENHMMCIIEALQEYNTHVFVQKTLCDYGMVPANRPNLYIEKFSPKSFLKFLHKNYKKICILIKSSPDSFEKEAKIYKCLSKYTFPKAIIPAGNDISRISDFFDYFFWQADNAADFGFCGHKKNTIIRPPAMQGINKEVSIPGFSSKPFFLTVFNCYNAELKGVNLLYDILDFLPYPLIWCSADNRPSNVNHPKLFKVCASRNILLMLMQTCRAYISFSNSEGFGWSVFEAMAYNRTVISKPVGVARDMQNSIIFYNTKEDLVKIINKPDLPVAKNYDLSCFRADIYRKQLSSIIIRHSAG
ncbi:MAG: hypothetical protein ABIA63_01950 [bacterium]